MTLEYQLSGEVEIETWEKSVDRAIEVYNSAVEEHNAKADEDEQYAYIERVCLSTWEHLPDGRERYQWVNPVRNHGMLFLECRPAQQDDNTR